MAAIYWVGETSSDPLDGDNWVAAGSGSPGTLPTAGDTVIYKSEYATRELAGDITSLGYFNLFVIATNDTDQSYHRVGRDYTGAPDPLILNTEHLLMNSSNYQGDNPNVKDSYGMYPNQSIVDLWDSDGVVKCSLCSINEGSRVTIHGVCNHFSTIYDPSSFSAVDPIRGIIHWTDSTRTGSSTLNGVVYKMDLCHGEIKYGADRHPGLDIIFEPTVGITVPAYTEPEFPDYTAPITIGVDSGYQVFEGTFPNPEGVRVVIFRVPVLTCINVYNQVDVHIEPVTEVGRASPWSTSAAKQTTVITPVVIERLFMEGLRHPDYPQHQGANLFLYGGLDVEDLQIHEPTCSIKFTGGNLPININGGMFDLYHDLWYGGWATPPPTSIDISEVSTGQLQISNFDRDPSSEEDFSQGMVMAGHFIPILMLVPANSYFTTKKDSGL